MKKIMIFILLVLLLSGCSKVDNNNIVIAEQEEKIGDLKAKVKELKNEIADLEKTVVNKKIEKDIAKYIVTIKIKQSHFGLDFENKIKDEMNAIEIDIPVDKGFYDSVYVGDVLDDSFRMGSFAMTGSIGSWDITISDKRIE